MLAYTKSRFHAVRVRFEEHVPTSPLNALLWEFFLFTFKQAWACLFGGTLLALVLLTKLFYPPHAWLARYDFLFLVALAIQALLLILRMETVREAKIILVFHIVGTVMEIFKTHVGSWQYPEPSFFRIGHVPLFSGFMYASVGSFIARISRIFDFRFTRYPSVKTTSLLAILIYVNFFTHHYLPDIRYPLFLFVAITFVPTWIYYRPYRTYRRMPLLLGFCLVALFIWLAENIGTFANIWVYVWSVARLQAKLFDDGSGLLLCIRLLSGAVHLLRAMMESAPTLSSIPQRSQLQTMDPIRIRAGRFDLFSHQQSTCKPGENLINLRRRREEKWEIAL